MNVPEHLYYYSLNNIIKVSNNIGFKKVKHITYGSGMTNKKDANLLFKISKTFLDKLVKWTDQGDMMAVHFTKV